MFYFRPWTFAILLFLFSIVFHSSIIAQTEEKKINDPKEEILIFRTSPGIETEAEGFFRFQVSTFSPILVVKVNGFAQMVNEGKDWAEYEMPFYLEEGKNLFKVFVQTKTGEKEREFIVNFEPLKREVKTPPPLNGVFMIGQTISNNVLNVKDGDSKTNATKYDFLLSIGYSLDFNEESNVLLSAVIKFDHFQNRSLLAEEVLFRQFSTDYRHKNLFGINFNAGIGQNVISLKNVDGSNPYKAGEFRKDVQSLFVFLGGTKKWGDFSGSFKIQNDSQDKINTDSEDGTLTLTSLGAKLRWDKFRFNSRLDSRSTTFKDESKDYNTTLIDIGTTYSWSPFVFGINFSNFDQQYKNPDPGSNIVLKIKKDEISLDSKYAFSSSTILGAGLKQIRQASSDILKSYSENQIIMQYIWMF